MLNIIIGDNSSGKTLMLDKLFSNISDQFNAVTNLYDVPTFDKIPYSAESIEIVEDAVTELDITIANNTVYDESKRYKNNFLAIVNCLCKDVAYILLDEPSIGITPADGLYSLCSALIRLGDTQRNIWITTTEEIFLNNDFEWVKYYTVVRDLNNEPMLKEVNSDGTAYN